MEIWKGVNGWKVSDLGRVWGARIGPFTPLSEDHGGYLKVTGNRKSAAVHRLVCIAFHGAPPSPKHTVDHKNRDRANNHVDNLAWSSPMMQAQNKAMCAPRLINHCKAVRMVAADGTATIFSSAKEASNQTGVGRGEISMHANGKRKRTKSGTKWEFV
jgi:hypothetical protein